MYNNIYIIFPDDEKDRQIAYELKRNLMEYKPPKNIHEKISQGRSVKAYIDGENENDEGIMESSDFLIVICSSRTPSCKKVIDYIKKYKEAGKSDHILTLLVEGDPSTSFPDIIREIRILDGKEEIIEPLAADIKADSIRQSIKLLRVEKLRLLAPIYGVSYDDLKQRYRERKIHSIRIAASSILLIVLCLSLGSYYQWQKTEQERRLQDKRTKMAMELLNQLYIDVPHKFDNIPQAKDVIYKILFDNIYSLDQTPGIDIDKIDLENILKVKEADSFYAVLGKALVFRHLDMREESGKIYEMIEEKYTKTDDVNINNYAMKSIEFYKKMSEFELDGGAYISQIMEGSPAKASKLQVGDILVRINTNAFNNVSGWFAIINGLPKDSTVEVTFMRLSHDGNFTVNNESIKLKDGKMGAVLNDI